MVNVTDSTPMTAVAVSPFNLSDPRYRCCCGCIHVRTGAYVVGFLQTFGLLTLVGRLSRVVNGFEAGVSVGIDYIPIATTALFLVANFISVFLLFVGICRGIPKFLIPMMIILVLCVLYYLTCTLVFICAMIFQSDLFFEFVKKQMEMETVKSDGSKEIVITKTGLFFSAFVFALAALFDVWWFCIVKACRSYLEDRNLFIERNATTYMVEEGGGLFEVLLFCCRRRGGDDDGPTIPDSQQEGSAHVPMGSIIQGASAPKMEEHFLNPPPSYNEVVADKSDPS